MTGAGAPEWTYTGTLLDHDAFYWTGMDCMQGRVAAQRWRLHGRVCVYHPSGPGPVHTGTLHLRQTHTPHLSMSTSCAAVSAACSSCSAACAAAWVAMTARLCFSSSAWVAAWRASVALSEAWASSTVFGAASCSREMEQPINQSWWRRWVAKTPGNTTQGKCRGRALAQHEAVLSETMSHASVRAFPQQRQQSSQASHARNEFAQVDVGQAPTLAAAATAAFWVDTARLTSELEARAAACSSLVRWVAARSALAACEQTARAKSQGGSSWWERLRRKTDQ